jgi:hypothetical protein
MKKALIDLESKLVVQVEDVMFDVASSHMWVDCPDNIVSHRYTYENNQFILIPEPTSEPLTAEEVRKIRNNLLTMSDWTQLPDSQVNKQSWASYRQSLRDITNQSGFPENVTWPTRP